MQLRTSSPSDHVLGHAGCFWSNYSTSHQELYTSNGVLLGIVRRGTDTASLLWTATLPSGRELKDRKDPYLNLARAKLLVETSARQSLHASLLLVLLQESRRYAVA